MISVVKKRVLILAVLLSVLAAGAVAYGQKVPSQPMYTVYVAADKGGKGTTLPVEAHEIIGNGLVMIGDWTITHLGNGPVNFAVDETNQTLFIINEFESTIQHIDAINGTNEGIETIAGLGDMAGLAFHQTRGHLYATERSGSAVWVIDPVNFTLIDTWTLPTGSGSYGIDLLGDTLYVADGTPTVRLYDIDTHAETDTVTLSTLALDVAATDDPSHMIITTTWDFDKAGEDVIKYDIATSTETSVDVGTFVRGVTLSPQDQLAYVTSEEALTVVDLATMTVASNYAYPGVTMSALVASKLTGLDMDDDDDDSGDDDDSVFDDDDDDDDAAGPGTGGMGDDDDADSGSGGSSSYPEDEEGKRCGG
jgi:hypothetical protein